MSDSEQEKTEQPTAHKLVRARQKGMVARGMDLGFLAATGMLFAYLSIEGEHLANVISRTAQRTFIVSGSLSGSADTLLKMSGQALADTMTPVFVFGLILFAGVLIVEYLQTGFVFSTESLKPDFGKLNPAKGLKRVLSWHMVLQSAKTIIKASSYVTIAIIVIRQEAGLAAAVFPDALALHLLLWKASIRLLGWCLLAAAVFAGLDQLIARRSFLKKMRMSRRDIHREHKDREGDPRLKSNRKRLHAEFVKASESIRGVRKADLLVVNPTHVAVGLKYDARTMDAPRIVCSGSNTLALRLKRLALAYSVPIIEDRLLARLLLGTQLGTAIPGAAYERVADHYLTTKRDHSKQVTADA